MNCRIIDRPLCAILYMGAVFIISLTTSCIVCAQHGIPIIQSCVCLMMFIVAGLTDALSAVIATIRMCLSLYFVIMSVSKGATVSALLSLVYCVMLLIKYAVPL